MAERFSRRRPARIVAALCLAIAGSCLTGAHTDELAAAATPAAKRTEAGPETAPAGEPFRLARIPYTAVRDLQREYDPFLAELARRLHAPRACLVLAPDYEGIVKRLVDREADAAWLGTLAYAQFKSRGLPLEPLVCPVRAAGKSYTGILIARKDGPVKQLADLKGRRFGFVDRHSASGFLFPKLLLEAAGLAVPGDLRTAKRGEPDFFGNHANVVLNVFLKRVDAGAVYEGAMEEALSAQPARVSELTVLARTDPIFGEPIVVLASMPPARQRQIRDAFLTLLADGKLKFEDLLGFAPVRDADYEPVKRLLARAARRPR